MDEKNPFGIFINNDALADRVLERLTKAVDTVLKVADQETMITKLTVPNEPDGMEISFHTQTQDLAYEKPELGETPAQKRLKQLKAEDRLRQWEVRLPVSDEAMKNKQGTGANLMSSIGAGKAFARAMDAEGFQNMYGALSGTVVSAPWNLGTNATMENDINLRMDAIEDEGFSGDSALMSRMQIGRLNHTLNVIMFGGRGITVKDWLMDNMELELYRVKRINYKNNNGTLIPLFNPFGQILIFDKSAYSVFTQEPMTVKVQRKEEIGAWITYIRKYFRTTPVQTEACEKLIGVNL